MLHRALWLTGLLVITSAFAAGPDAPVRPKDRAHLKDLYFGEALYDAYQGEWFDAISRLDTELSQYHTLDEPGRDTLFPHIGDAEFSVGDFELHYRMHRRAGRAIKAVLEGNVEPVVRNEAAFRLARIYFRKDQPADALTAIERIKGPLPDRIRDDAAFLRAEILMANGRFTEAEKVLRGLVGVKALDGFTQYNLGIALLKSGHVAEGYQQLDRAGQITGTDRAALGIRDKANLVLGTTLLEAKKAEAATQYLDRVRLSGPFSTRALLASGWANVSLNRFDRALVPWSLLVRRNVTDGAVQEGMLALPYAYAQLHVYGKAALLYGQTLDAFGNELTKLDNSLKSIREGKFLQALQREELKQDKDWVVKLRSLPETPETYYLMELMASNDFQESLKNYLDLNELTKKMASWDDTLDSFAELIRLRRGFYQPLLPDIDKRFRVLDSQLRLRTEQRDHLDNRIKAMLLSPRPDFLATAGERVMLLNIADMEKRIREGGKLHPAAAAEAEGRIGRLKSVLRFRIDTDYDRRLTEAYRDLRQLDEVMAKSRRDYQSFVRTRQAATQSYEGYDDTIVRLRSRLAAAREQVKLLMARQGHVLEVMAINELELRRQRLEGYQVKARFAMADAYDRAVKAEQAEQVEQAGDRKK
jgi:Flp pilus assembly protein TadD